MNLLNERCDLLIDYISQILVYGSNVKGTIVLKNNEFEDGKYLISDISVIQNNYYRWHDLGIKSVDILKFYKLFLNRVVDKFKKFEISKENSKIVIHSSVNNNFISIVFDLDNKSKKDWFDKFDCQI